MKRTYQLLCITLLGVILTGACRSPPPDRGPVIGVVIRDDKLQVVKSLSESDTASFNSYWDTKTSVAMPWGSQGRRVVLDVTRKGGGRRWYYWTNGYLQVLSIPDTPVYRIADPEAFNRLLGLQD